MCSERRGASLAWPNTVTTLTLVDVSHWLLKGCLVPPRVQYGGGIFISGVNNATDVNITRAASYYVRVIYGLCLAGSPDILVSVSHRQHHH